MTVRIPRELHFEPPTRHVEIDRLGDGLVIRPIQRPLTNVLRKFKAFSPDFMSGGRDNI